MNDKLEAFRKRLRVPEREKRNWQSWVGSPTAWLALILSASSFFYTFLYHSDELSVVIDEPVIQLNRQNKIEITSPRGVTFINSGSRPVAVTGVRLNIMQRYESFPNPRCKDSYSKNIHFVFEQTVIKPYDAISKPVKFANEERYSENITFENQTHNVLAVCAIFQLAATDGAKWQKTVSLGPYRGVNLGNWISENDKDAPAYLIKRNRFWTVVDRDRYMEAPDE
jgi:hypothetical protein